MLYVEATLQTLSMLLFSGLVATALGGLIGAVLVLTGHPLLLPRPRLYRALDGAVNTLRSFPFIILMILLFPLSRLIVGTTIGTVATIIPLAVAAAPFVGRVVQGALKGVDDGVVEAAVVMGTPPLEILVYVLLPEALPALIEGATLMLINLVGYSAMAGAIGGGGLGDLAIRYGFHRSDEVVLAISVLLLLLLVQGIQRLGDFFENKERKRRQLGGNRI